MSYLQLTTVQSKIHNQQATVKHFEPIDDYAK